MNHPKILFMISGSIAAFKAATAISLLVKRNCEVQVVATTSALRFVGEATFEGLTGRKVQTGMFQPGEAMSHIELERWADLIVVCPASANTLNKFASGIADDLLSTLFLAHEFKKPFLVFPAMNTAMWKHPVTQKSLETLRGMGLKVLEPRAGELACGEVGEGRLLEPHEIVEEVDRALLSPNTKGRVLVTAGGTEEKIDGVRSVTNFSTGRTGVGIATELSRLGYQVTLLCQNRVNVLGCNQVEVVRFFDFASLQLEIQKALGEKSFDWVIHAAAVSDYSIDFIELDSNRITPSGDAKLSSESQKMVLHLKKNPKIIDSILSFSRNPNIKVVGFKLTQGETEAGRARLLQRVFSSPGVEWVVENDRNQISQERHPFRIFDRDLDFVEVDGYQNLVRYFVEEVGI